MPRSQLRLLGLLALSWTAASSRAAAQERLDSSIRAWADLGIYSGDVLLDGVAVTAFTPVLRAEIELSSLQLGLDLPFALGDGSVDSALGDSSSAFGSRLGNPTLHLDYVVEQRPLRASAGLALAIPTDDGENDPGDDAAAAADLAAAAGMYSRGLWNSWWYVADAWVLIVPATIDSVTSDSEIGFEGALAWYLRRDKGADNSGVFQLGFHAAAVIDPAVVGARLMGVFSLDDRVAGEDQFQSSLELYAELRLPILWLGAGVDVVLDEPLGVFGDGADFWGLRVSGGVAF